LNTEIGGIFGGSSELGGAGENNNLWDSILKEVAQRDDVKESHLIILGDKGVGKKTLIHTLNKQFIKSTNKCIKVEDMCSNNAGLDYAFLYVKDLSEKDALTSLVTSEDNLPKLNTWLI
jgi:predicted AAA+ superfamily ATPase